MEWFGLESIHQRKLVNVDEVVTLASEVLVTDLSQADNQIRRQSTIELVTSPGEDQFGLRAITGLDFNAERFLDVLDSCSVEMNLDSFKSDLLHSTVVHLMEGAVKSLFDVRGTFLVRHCEGIERAELFAVGVAEAEELVENPEGFAAIDEAIELVVTGRNAATQTLVAMFVIYETQFLVLENVVRLAHLVQFKHVRGELLAGMASRVHLRSKLSERLSDLFSVGLVLDAENLVVASWLAHLLN